MARDEVIMASREFQSPSVEFKIQHAYIAIFAYGYWAVVTCPRVISLHREKGHEAVRNAGKRLTSTICIGCRDYDRHFVTHECGNYFSVAFGNFLQHICPVSTSMRHG